MGLVLPRTCSLPSTDGRGQRGTHRVSVRRLRERVGRSPRPLVGPSVFEATEPMFAPDLVWLRWLKARARSSRDRYLTDPETGVASVKAEAAICVQNVDVQCVLQFTLIHAAGCVLHRHTSRVIHRLEFSLSHSLRLLGAGFTVKANQHTNKVFGKKKGKNHARATRTEHRSVPREWNTSLKPRTGRSTDVG